MTRITLPLLIALAAGPATADTAEVLAAHATRTGEGWSISVTLAHHDTGWDHYANAWQIESADGQVLGTRLLSHPHVEEQPFTRSLAGVAIPAGLDHVLIRVRCNLDGWSPRLVRLDLPK
ncbi:hypothetical protein [Defluviimonas sp. WL0075]|uniref:Uncharacterized protein n=1 Tax=Albidovulum sediminicola TaxID=2984331 RepID=A0ABT2Z4I1_9RHOB|nr:hypothetical protein [Defluviimonas sp. WL0075]MCV2865991.1 hypothetical protein [Defluviimonas sp. WL0075]